MCIHSSMLPVQQTTEQHDCVTCTSDLKRYNVCSLIKAHHACFCNLLTNGSIRNQIVHKDKLKPWLECSVLSFVDYSLKLCNPFINCDLPCKILMVILCNQCQVLCQVLNLVSAFYSIKLWMPYKGITKP